MNKLYRNEDWLYQEYWNEGLSLGEIAKSCKISKSTIRYWMDKFKLKRRNQSESQLERNRRKPILYNKKWLYQRYIVERLSSPKIAKLCNCNHLTILNWLRKFKIKIRNYYEINGGKLNGNYGRKHSRETRKKISEHHKEYYKNNPHPCLGRHSPQTEAQKKKMRELWKTPEFIKKAIKRNRKPNNLEKAFNNITPDLVRYVGNGTWWRKLPNGRYKNPDFKITGQNKVIEVFGGKGYFHTEKEAGELKQLFAQIGINCLVIWENEIYKQPEQVLGKVINFI